VFKDGRYLFQPLLVDQDRLDSGLFKNPDGGAWQSYLRQYGVDYAITDYRAYAIPPRGRTPFALRMKGYKRNKGYKG
jgi:hypothetical protein